MISYSSASMIGTTYPVACTLTKTFTLHFVDVTLSTTGANGHPGAISSDES